MKALPLSAVHQRCGASFCEVEGLEVPAHYGDALAEAQLLRSGLGLVDRSWVSRLELRGEDRCRFLSGLITSNVADLAPGSNVYGFLTDIQGRVQADAYVTALPDRLWLELPPRRQAAVRAHLEKYVVADRVEVASIDDLLPLSLIGAGVAGCVEKLGAELPEAAGRNLRTCVLGTEVQLSWRLLYGRPAATIWVSAGIADVLWNEMVDATEVSPVGFEALEEIRIEAGFGRWGKDFDEKSLPQETGLLDEAVDFEKGCYLGQEIVARLHYRGTPRRLLKALEVASSEPPPEGAIVVSEGEEVGRLTSVAATASAAGWAALSAVSSGVLEAQLPMQLEDGSLVRVRDVAAPVASD